MINLIYTLDGAATVIERDILMANGTAGEYGQAVIVEDGRLSVATGTDKPFAVLIADTEAGTDVKTEYVPVREDQVFEIDLEDDTDIEGLIGNRASLDSTGKYLDLDPDTPGSILVLRVDPIRNKATVRFVE